MIDSMSITDILGQKLNFTIGESPTNPFHPVQHFESTPEVRSTPQNRMQAHGVWPHPTYMGAGIITIEGAVFGDNYTEFNANYQILKTIVHPIVGVVARDNTRVGTLKLKPTGLAQIETDFALQAFTCPLNGNTYAEWQLILEAFDPFFTQTASGIRVLY